MNIINDKIILRSIETEDKNLLHELINDPNIEKSVGGWSFPVSNYKQEKWIESQQLTNSNSLLRLIITDKSNNNGVGTLILSDIDYKNGSAEIHIKISNQYQGKGFAKSSLSAIIKYCASELRLHSLYAKILEDNVGSRKLFESNGFALDGLERERIFKSGKFNNVAIYTLILEG
jgi:RimJ/RimL family protein N-acetyltransferase